MLPFGTPAEFLREECFAKMNPGAVPSPRLRSRGLKVNSDWFTDALGSHARVLESDLRHACLGRVFWMTQEEFEVDSVGSLMTTPSLISEGAQRDLTR